MHEGKIGEWSKRRITERGKAQELRRETKR